MKAQAQELAILSVILAVTCLVFWETRQFGEASAGQTYLAGFPRLAAGTMGLMAVFRAVFFVFWRVPERAKFGRYLGLI